MKTVLTLFIVAFLAIASARGATPGALQIYFIDVEGGQSTLLVKRPCDDSPSAERLAQQQ
jgi:hypothetical protein